MVLAKLVTTLDQSIFGTVIAALLPTTYTNTASKPFHATTPRYRHIPECCCVSSAAATCPLCRVVRLLATTPTGKVLGEPLGRHCYTLLLRMSKHPHTHTVKLLAPRELFRATTKTGFELDSDENTTERLSVGHPLLTLWDWHTTNDNRYCGIIGIEGNPMIGRLLPTTGDRAKRINSVNWIRLFCQYPPTYTLPPPVQSQPNEGTGCTRSCTVQLRKSCVIWGKLLYFPATEQNS